jgi:ABC-type Fe3+/spermidine/putrescine transport system ATPase subunit
MAMIDLRDLQVGYGEGAVLDGFNLTVDKGELVCLLGPSGCGKTTALRAVGGYHLPDAGKVLIDGGGYGTPPARAAPGGPRYSSRTRCSRT